MRVDVQKWLFIAANDHKDAFFKRAQEIGLIEFINNGSQLRYEASAPQLEVLQALRVLKGVNGATKACQSHERDYQALAQRCLYLQSSIDQAVEESQQIQEELHRLQVLGEFSLQKLDQISLQSSLKPRFICCESAYQPALENLFKLGTREGVDYFLWFSQGQATPRGVTPMTIEKDPSQLRELLVKRERDLKEFAKELQVIKTFEPELKEYLIALINDASLERAQQGSKQAMQGYLFYATGWVARSRQNEIQALCVEFNIVASPVEIDKGETPPTELFNHGVSRIGQDLIGIYDVPANDDKDPSTWVLVFFAIFFSIIIGDAGYGLVFLLASVYVHNKATQAKGLALRLKKLAFILSLSCIAWGTMTNAFFGMSFEPSHPIRKVSLLHTLCKAKARYHWDQKDEVYHEYVQKMPQLANLRPTAAQQILEQGYINTPGGPRYDLLNSFSDSILKEISLLLGAVHLILSLARYLRRNWAWAGWIIFIIGSWLYFPQIVKATTFVNYLLYIDPITSQQIGLQMVYLGIATSLIIAPIQNRWSGLLEFMNLIQVFSDGLSYLRLYALGLAGGMMSSTFNELAVASGPVAGVFIMIAGHFINIILGIIGGVIHGLRLNFLEWYHYSFAGGGRWHRPLKKAQVDETF